MGKYTLEEQFNAAAEIVQNLPKEGPLQPTIPEKLKAYKLYKQATVGPCTTEAPPLFLLEARMKWTAWKSMGDMSKEEAMAIYVDSFLEECEKAEDKYDIMEFVTDPQWAQYLHLEPIFRKNFEILGRTTVKGYEGKVITYNGVQIQL